jgi:predicted Zn-dependent peptidase
VITSQRFSNGLTVIVEEMDHVESVSYDLVMPGGYLCDEPHTVGASVMLADLIGRGAGSFDSRALSEAFEDSGIRHGEGAGSDRLAFSGSLVADKLARALELVADMVLRPHLPATEIDPIRSVMLQDLASLADNPARRALVELTKRYCPAPYNRSSLGESSGIEATTQDTLRQLHQRYCTAGGAILSIAGRVAASNVLSLAERYFGGWSGSACEIPPFSGASPHQYHHIESDSAQVQIAMASPSVRFGDQRYYSGKIAVSLLGASMFGRLFMELREKRGLCYSVYARHSSNASHGTVTAYVGTTPERAQESLDTLLHEFSRIWGSVSSEEVERAKTNLKSALIMGEESPASRASSNATDWWLLKRVRSLREISGEIDKVGVNEVYDFLDHHPLSPATVLTLGRAPLAVPSYVIGG